MPLPLMRQSANRKSKMASNEFQPLQGMSDIRTPEIYLWRMIEEKARTIFNTYGYEEIRTPVLEKLSVFQRSLGDSTDVVKKEMYSFKPSKHELAMRPEGTAGTVRHLAGRGEEGLNARVFYISSMFRYERPQAGRKRQFHQIGVEATGEPNPLADAECIALQQHLLSAWGLTGSKIQISTRGMPSDRAPVAEGLRKALQPHLQELCGDCQRRIDENVLRVIDCKNEGCVHIVDQIPSALEFMSGESRAYLDRVISVLKTMGITAELNPRLVRGLDYYVHTVWEITHDALGAQNAIAGGGRYEIALGRKAVPGVGFALGMERVITALEACGIQGEQFAPAGGVWLISLGEAALLENMKLAAELRADGVRCGLELEAKSMKAQMRKASRSGAEKVIIRGDEELAKDIAVVKDMQEGSQEERSLEDVIRSLNP
jgi:histidyl-tRNA synthetase